MGLFDFSGYFLLPSVFFFMLQRVECLSMEFIVLFCANTPT
jgi:hypothetical protein